MFDPWQHIGTSEPLNPRPPQSRTKNAESVKSRRKKVTVLVVDDEQVIADTTKEILKRSGFDAHCAYDGQSGLELAMQLSPDFVLTDVVMPNMNGVQLAISLRKALPATEILDRGRREGHSFELIAKPVHPEKLLQRLRQK